MLFAMSDLALSTTAPFPSLSAMVAQTGRFRGGFLLLLAAITGVLAALVVAFVGWATQAAHKVLFQLPAAERLSAQFSLAST